MSRSTSASLFGFRTASGASLVNVYIDASGRLSLRNNIGSVTSYSTSTIAAGSWHRVTLHAGVNGSSSSLDVGLDGVAVSGLSLTGHNLGTARRLQNCSSAIRLPGAPTTSHVMTYRCHR